MSIETVLLNDNNKYRKFTGIDNFHKAGYFGERVTAASGEIWSLKTYNPGNQCFNPEYFNSTENTHSINTAATFFQVAPKAKLYMLYSTNGRYGVSYESKFFDHSTEIIDKYNITNMFTSLMAVKHPDWYKDLSTWMNDHEQFKWFWAAGNDNNFYNPIISVEQMFGVSSYVLSTDNIPHLSSLYYNDDIIEFIYTAPTMTYTNIRARKETDVGYMNNGTSFSAAWLCGMMVLVDDFFIDKCDRPLTRNGMKQFMDDHSTTLYKSNVDGSVTSKLIRLPDPIHINIDKYINII